MSTIVAPSLLSADFGDLRKDLEMINRSQADMLHLDIMDGVFASLYKACWIESDDEAELDAFKKRKYQFMATDMEGRDVFLADSGYVLQMAQIDFKHIKFHFTSEF